MFPHSKSAFHIWTLIAVLASNLGSAVTFTPAYAAGSISVNSNLDTIANDGKCTLREAITSANTDTASGGAGGECAAGSGADTITFAANYTITLVGSQLPAVTTAIIIHGSGAANTIIQANAIANTATYRVFEATNTGNLTLDSLTVRNGRCDGSSCAVGGGILNGGALIVSNVTFSANSATYGGGMSNLYGSANPTLTNVTFSGNTATSDGGGMYNYSSSSPTLTNVTFSGNSAGNYYGGYGGGMYNNNSSSPTLTDVTFSGNSATYGGGGMYNTNSSATLTNVTFSGASATNGGGMYNDHSSATLTNVTFSGNSASSGGGMYNYFSSPMLKNTLIANSPSGGDCVNNLSTLNAASSNNLIEDSLNACGLTDGVNGNIIGQDPALGALANNGGFTKTQALLAGSPAIDAGTNTGCPATDQRGFHRPANGICDVGAVEYELRIFLPLVEK